MHTDAVRELVAAIDEAKPWMQQGFGWIKATKRIFAAVKAVKAEEKPQTHEFDGLNYPVDVCGVGDCGLSVNAPIHQTGGR